MRENERKKKTETKSVLWFEGIELLVRVVEIMCEVLYYMMDMIVSE